MINYSDAARNARMRALIPLVSGGRLEIGTAAMAQVLAAVPVTGAEVRYATLTLTAGQGVVGADGDAASARVVSGSSEVVIDGLTVAAAETPQARTADLVLGTTRLGRGGVVAISLLAFKHM